MQELLLFDCLNFNEKSPRQFRQGNQCHLPIFFINFFYKEGIGHKHTRDELEYPTEMVGFKQKKLKNVAFLPV